MDEPNYLEQCISHGGGSKAIDTWLDLRRVLMERTVLGWRFEVINPDHQPEATWSLGLEGANRLVVEPLLAVDGVEGVYVFDSDHDLERRFPSIESFVSWLDEHEHEYEGLTPLQQELLDHLLDVNQRRWTKEQGL